MRGWGALAGLAGSRRARSPVWSPVVRWLLVRWCSGGSLEAARVGLTLRNGGWHVGAWWGAAAMAVVIVWGGEGCGGAGGG